MTLTGKYVFLRAIEPADLQLLYKWENDTSVWKVSNTIRPFSKHILEKYIQDSHLDIYTTKQLRLIICKTGGTPIGTIDLFDFDPYHLRAGIGILIADEKEKQNGFGNEALKLLVDYCFSVLHLHQLFCNITADNKPSLKLFAKHKFKTSGFKKQWIRDGNKFVNEYFLQLINVKG